MMILGCMSSKCTQAGPDYWCKSYDTVLECNVSTYQTLIQSI